MFSDSDSAGSTTPDEFEDTPAPSPGPSSKAGDSATDQIKLLRDLCSQGLLAKKDLAAMILKILSKPTEAATIQASSNQSKRKQDDVQASGFADEALRSKKKFRRTASPETCQIQKIIASPIERRFQIECAKTSSPLFGKVPPKRLREEVFEVACKSPLEEIYTNHAKELKNVASSKVMSIVKWKIRKMRANRTPAKHHIGDNFDFEAAAKKLDSKLFASNATTRRRNFFYEKTRYAHQSSLNSFDSKTPPPLSNTHHYRLLQVVNDFVQQR